MNYIQKCIKYFQTKFFPLCLVCILIYLLVLLIIFLVLPTLPKSVDIEIERNRSIAICQQRSCLYQWIRDYQSNAKRKQIRQVCPGYVWSKFIKTTFQMYQEKKVDWEFLQGIYRYRWYHKCHTNCSIDGPFHYIPSFINYQLQLSKAWTQPKLCNKPYHNKNTCRWRGHSVSFKIYFAFFSIPATIIFNYINLTTLKRLLGEGAGAALYLHAAEIITDGLLNIIEGLHHCLHIFGAIDHWRQTCGYYQYSSLQQSAGIVQRFVSFLNQAYLMALLADRLYALTKPYQYNNIVYNDSKKVKHYKSIILKILMGSFTLYFPIIFYRSFLPIFHYWAKISKFWEDHLDRIDFTLSNFYVIIGFAILILQIICGVIVEKKYRKFIKNKINFKQESEAELKKKERDKQLLLFGTIGLNVITGLVKMAFSIIVNGPFYRIFGIADFRPWWSFIVRMADPVLTFINGNGGLVIHILTVKSYRKAFKATRFGRLIFRNQQVSPSQQNH